jgi:hypothetical protein
MKSMLKKLYKNVRESSLAIVKPLEKEDYIPQAAVFASPPKWNLGHTTWFFEEIILSKYKADYRIFHPKYSYLFNSYYNTVGERVLRHDRGNLSRPTVDEVLEYRKYVDRHMLVFLSEEQLKNQVKDLVVLGINHEQQHQELFFTDLKYTFSVNPLYPAYSDKAFCEDKNSGESGFFSMRGWFLLR